MPFCHSCLANHSQALIHRSHSSCKLFGLHQQDALLRSPFLQRRAIARLSPPRHPSAPRPVRTAAAAAAADVAYAAAAAAGLAGAAGACASGGPSPLLLVAAAAAPVAKVALCCLVGAWASAKGLLPAEGRRLLSGLSLNVFTPAMLFSKLAGGVGVAEVAGMWVLTASMVASHVVGLLLGWLVTALPPAAVPPRLRPHVALCCGVGNVGNLPFMLLAGMAGDAALPFAAAVGGAAAAQEVANRYVALSNLSASLIQFPLTCVGLLPRPPPATPTQEPGAAESGQGGQTLDTPPNPATPDPKPPPPPPPQPPPPPSPDSQSQTSPPPSTAAALPSPAPAPSLSWRTLLGGVLSPPTIACLLAVAAASSSSIKAALYSPRGCLRLLGEVADTLGAVAIPLLLVTLGANLARGPGVARGRLPAATCAAVVVTRLVLLPAVCGGLLLAAWRAGLLPPGGTDPLGLLTMLVMHSTPTAVLVHSVASLYGNAEDEVAVLLFWQYVACLVTLPLTIGAALALLGPAAASPGAWAGLAGAAAAAAG